MAVAGVVLVALRAAGIALLFLADHVNEDGNPWQSRWQVFAWAGLAVLVVGPALVQNPLGGGFWWALVRTYDGEPLRVRRIFAGFGFWRYLKLAGIGLVEFLILALPLAVAIAIWAVATCAMGIFGMLGLPFMLAAFAILWPVGGTIITIVHYFFYLAPPAVMAARSVGMWRAIACGLSAMWRRPLNYLGVFALVLLGWMPIAAGWATVAWTAPAALAWMSIAGAEHPVARVFVWIGYGLAIVLLLVASTWWGLVSGYLKAALFRSSFGLSLETSRTVAPPVVPAPPPEPTPVETACGS